MLELLINYVFTFEKLFGLISFIIIIGMSEQGLKNPLAYGL
jgi:hypothetical protein